jgi:hypothetical protein
MDRKKDVKLKNAKRNKEKNKNRNPGKLQNHPCFFTMKMTDIMRAFSTRYARNSDLEKNSSRREHS